MRLAAIFASAFAVLAFQCGGQVDEQCPSAPDQSCVQEGKSCTFPTMICGTQTTETCTCKDGVYACPLYEDCPAQTCPIDTYPGSSCSMNGLQCESMMQSECSTTPIMCTCNGSTFQCPVPDCPPVPSCPPPDSITPGSGCSSPNSECAGPDNSECFCNGGTWSCAFAVDGGGPIDAGGTD